MNGVETVDMLFAAALILALGTAGMYGDERADGRDRAPSAPAHVADTQSNRTAQARRRRAWKAARFVLVLIAVAFAMAWVGTPDVTAPAVAGPTH